MRKSRFTIEQIIGFLKQAAAGMAVRTDNDPEFTSRAFIAWIQRHGFGTC